MTKHKMKWLMGFSLGLILGCIVGVVVYQQLRNTKTEESTVIYQGEADNIQDVIFSPDGKFIASVHSDDHIRVWNAQNHELVYDLISPFERSCVSGAVSVDFSPDNQQLVVALTGGEVQIWDMQSGALSTSFRTDDSCLTHDVRFSPDGASVLTSGDKVQLWDVQTGNLITTYIETGPRISFHPNGDWLATGQNVSQTSYQIISLTDADQKFFVAISDAENIYDIEFSSDGGRIALVTSHSLYIQDVSGLPEQVGALTPQMDGVHHFRDVAFSPNRDLVAVSGLTSEIELWRIEEVDGELSLHKQAVLTGFSGGVSAIDFSPDGQWLISSGEDGRLRIWDIREVK